MFKSPLYAISFEDNYGGGIHRTVNSFSNAVCYACKLFGLLLPEENNPARFLAACENPEFLARVDVFECDSWDDADEQFADATFVPLFHLENGMDFRG